MTIAILIHALLFLAFWLTNLPYQETLNNFMVGATGLRMNFLLIFMIFAGLVALWSAARLVGRRKVQHRVLIRLYLSVGIFFLLFFYGIFIFLFLKNPTQWYRLGQLVQYFRLPIDTALLLLLAWGLRRWMKKGSRRNNILLATILLVTWLIPAFYSPGNVQRGALPEKPRLMAHRGAASLAPENTITAMQAAADIGIHGLETDITVSNDGVLFLMHDSTLARTTDVAQVFPGREDDPADTFSWDELSQLNAGSWFDGQTEYPNESIPTLEALLPLVRDNDLYFIYDLRIPPAGHPYSDQALNLCLEQIKAADVMDHTWILVKPEEIDQVRLILPEAILAAGIGNSDQPPAPVALVADGYQVVNSTYNLSNGKIKAYQDAGLWVNLWVVDETWQYSRLWLAGANSVTSNYVQTFATMSRPIGVITPAIHLAVWGVVGLLATWLHFSKKP